MEKKFQADQVLLKRITDLATGAGALTVLRELKKINDENQPKD